MPECHCSSLRRHDTKMKSVASGAAPQPFPAVLPRAEPPELLGLSSCFFLLPSPHLPRVFALSPSCGKIFTFKFIFFCEDYKKKWMDTYLWQWRKGSSEEEKWFWSSKLRKGAGAWETDADGHSILPHVCGRYKCPQWNSSPCTHTLAVPSFVHARGTCSHHFRLSTAWLIFYFPPPPPLFCIWSHAEPHFSHRTQHFAAHSIIQQTKPMKWARKGHE